VPGWEPGRKRDEAQLLRYVTELPLSVLDLSPVAVGTTSGQALDNTTQLARRTEELGYRRFWVAEHHNMPAIASSAPAVLIAHLAAATSTIRVGSGGVMLPNHAPLVVAEQFGTLEALHPGRIDLGIGRAPGTDQLTALALRRTMEGLSAEKFPEELLDLIRLFAGDTRARVTATPGAGDMPALWLLGSSGYSAQLAGMLGLPFSFAHHFSAANTLPALQMYREHFRPSQWLERPYAMVAVNTICADTDEGARWLAGPAVLSFMRLRTGHLQPLATPEEAAAYPYTPEEREMAWSRFDQQAIGSPDTVRSQLSGLLERTQANEMMLTTMVYDIGDRIRSFELISEKVAPALQVGPEVS
jgi:luciferase family oxidoreductase group 1